jgi:nitrogen regulatory protein PII
MKQIIAVVKPYLAENVLAALVEVPLLASHVVEVKGYGRQKSYLDQYGESEYAPAFLPKVEINLFLEDEHIETAVQKILQAARTGRMGDGKVFILGTVPEAKAIEF